MYEIDKQKFREIMIGEERYSPRKVDLLLAEFPPVDDRFGEPIEQWLEDRTVPDIEVEGLSLREVMDNKQVHFLVAVRTLNELLHDRFLPADRSRRIKALRTPVVFE